jgi:cell division protein FtsB
MTQRNRKIFLTAGLIALLALLWLALSPWGAVSYLRLRHELQELRAANRALAENNRALEQEIERLKNDRAYLEKVAREEYGLLKKNEVLYQEQPAPPKH